MSLESLAAYGGPLTALLYPYGRHQFVLGQEIFAICDAHSARFTENECDIKKGQQCRVLDLSQVDSTRYVTVEVDGVRATFADTSFSAVAE